jgi:predicted AlkP superfamily pyrophosphatase or phosphodiesterase
LLIVISVDQLSADLFDEYRPMLFGGLGRLARGTLFRNGYQGHAATETCPGHSTILTGVRPARSGIIGNSWIDQSLTRSDKSVYCAEDERAPGSSSTSYKVSPIHLKAPTLGEQLKSVSAASKNVAVAGKDRSAVMMGGKLVDQRWYWDGKRFSSDLAIAPPASVAAANTAVAALIAAPQAPLDAPELCASKATPVPVGNRSIGAGRFERAAGDRSAFRSSPAFDGAVLALAAGLIRELALGQDNSTDILSIGLSGTDYVGHYFGSGGQEMCLQLLSLDRDLRDFFQVLDSNGIDYAVALTADHGGEDVPERLRQQGVAAERADPGLAASQVGKAIGARPGLTGPLLIGDVSGDIYLDRSIKAADRANVLREAVAAYRGHRQVEAVFTAQELGRAPLPTTNPDRWTLLERARASFDPERSGDFVVLLRQHVTSIPGTTGALANHGSPWDYDRRVPILFWRPAMAQSLRNDAVETADIMPTLAAMLGLAIDPKSVDGRCLTAIQGVACPPR